VAGSWELRAAGLGAGSLGMQSKTWELGAGRWELGTGVESCEAGVWELGDAV
jgi:hypothetical protein